jgi:hypothetical protein
LIEMKRRVRPVREKDISDIRALTELEAKERKNERRTQNE